MKSNTKNRTLTQCALTILMATLFVACSDYDNGYTEKQIQFMQNFKDVFGEIDHNNDWNLVERGTVTVTASQSSRVKIYANTFGTYKLVGDYQNVVGTRTLGFDMVEGTTDIMVSNGHSAQKAKVGDAITLGSTRSVYVSTEEEGADGVTKAIVTVDEEFTYVAPVYTQKITDPETGLLPQENPEVDNTNKIIQNFTYVSNGEFIMFPILRETGSYHILGIYWADDDGNIRTQDVYKNGTENDELGATANESKGIHITLKEGIEFGFYLRVYSNPNDEGTYHHTVYSEAELNTLYKGTFFGKMPPTSQMKGLNYADGNTFAGTTNLTVTAPDRNGVEGTRSVNYLCFEDWNLAGPDYNDLIFILTGDAIPTIVDADPVTWVLSAEDLGGTFDIDYNDVVIAVNHIGGHDKATIVPLAAGGTLASYIYFNDVNGNDVCVCEIHEPFGQGRDTPSGSYEPVNVDARTPSNAADITYEVDVDPETWTLKTFLPDQDIDANEEWQQSHTMGGFYIKVLTEGQTGEPTSAPNEQEIQKIQNQSTNSKDNVPYIICTPMAWRRENISDQTVTVGNYRWPQEHVAMFQFGEFTGAAYKIGNEYPFLKWVRGDNDDIAREWYKYPVVGITCSSRSPITIDNAPTEYSNFYVYNNNVNLALAQTGTVNYGTASRGKITVSYSEEGIVEIELDEKTKTITIHPKKIGNTQITLTQAQADGYYGATATIYVTVSEKLNANLSVTQNYIMIEKGQEQEMYIDYSTDSDGQLELSWDNENIASAELTTQDGKNMLKITEGTTAGKATLTIKQEETELYYAAETTVVVEVLDLTDYIIPENGSKDLTEFLSMGKIPATIFQNLNSKITITITATDGWSQLDYIKINNVQQNGWSGEYTLLGWTEIKSDEPKTITLESGGSIDNSGYSISHEDIIKGIKETGLQISGQNITLRITIE